jgi:hypothetical protein
VKKEINMTVTGSGKELTGHILLPGESTGAESVICNGTPVSFKISLIEKSKYIDFNLPLENTMSFKITYK